MKRIAIFMPFYFDYESTIKKALDNCNHEVYMINDNWDELSIVNHMYNVYFKDKAREKKDNFYESEINKLPEYLDYILIITGRSLSPEIMEYLRYKYTDSIFIMYQWDCVSQAPQAEYIAKYCDRNLTFDFRDSEKYGWGYRPLFFDNSRIINVRKYYDLAYICSMHSQRYDLQGKLPTCMIYAFLMVG